MRSPRSLKRFATSGSENDGSLIRVPIHASRRIAVLDMYPCEDKLGHIHTPSASACFACCTALPGTGALGEEGVRPFCASSKRAHCVASSAAARSAFAKRSCAICTRDRRSNLVLSSARAAALLCRPGPIGGVATECSQQARRDDRNREGARPAWRRGRNDAAQRRGHARFPATGALHGHAAAASPPFVHVAGPPPSRPQPSRPQRPHQSMAVMNPIYLLLSSP